MKKTHGKAMTFRQKIISAALVALIAFSLSTSLLLIIWMASAQRRELAGQPPLQSDPNEPIQRPDGNLTPEEQRGYFLGSIWGPDWRTEALKTPLVKTPWNNIDLSAVCAGTDLELAMITCMVLEFNPHLMQAGDEALIEIGDDFWIDLKSMKETFTGIGFTLTEEHVVLSGYRNGQYFELLFSDASLGTIANTILPNVTTSQ